MISRHTRNFLVFSAVLVLLLFVAFRISSIINSFVPFLNTLKPLFLYPHATYEEKMSMKYSEYIDFIEKVKAITPENSVIYFPRINIPRGMPMWVAGQLKVDAALLFPRNVAWFDNYAIHKGETHTYIAFIKGSPQQAIKAKEVYVIKDNIQIYFRDYDPEVFGDSENGLIQL